MRAVHWVGAFVFVLLLTTEAQAKTVGVISVQAQPDIRFILQTQAGLSAYSVITSSISLAQVQPLFSKIEIQNTDYIQGEYTLSGRTDKVKLAIGAAGWAIAWHTQDYASQYLYDCAGFDGAHPEQMIGQPERTVMEVASALNVPSPVISFYDYRNMLAEGINLHWLFLPGNGTQTSTITLPIANTYLERGYVFCTALSNSKLWLNNAIVDQQGSVSQVVYRWGALDSSQLRAGQTNSLKIEDLTFFGYGFVGGVSTVYTNTTTITTSGGYVRDLSLTYPTLFGAPLTIYQVYLPALRK
jgi:hypothetical protein